MDEYQNGKSVLHKMRDATQTIAAPQPSPSA
jgi:hypothetical protein